MTDMNGQTAKSYEYDAYGNILQETGPSLTGGFTYTARELHTRSGLYYYRARFYDPRTGRFLTQDPIGHLGGVNLYAYVGNDGVNFIDPLGLIELILVGGNKANPPFFTNIASDWAGDRYPEDVKIIQVRNFQDVQNALTSNKDITKLTYIGHAGPGALYLSDAALTVESVKQLNRENISPDAQIFLYGCHTADRPEGEGKTSMAEAVHSHFQRDTMGWTGDLSFTLSIPRGSLRDPFAHERWFTD
ncbi:MAG: hypothetical protein Kow0099_35260 [Candidatus Abyssubacteria bacterium]